MHNAMNGFLMQIHFYLPCVSYLRCNDPIVLPVAYDQSLSLFFPSLHLGIKEYRPRITAFQEDGSKLGIK